MCDILRWLSVKVTHHKTDGVIEVQARHPLGVAPYELVRKMRASVCFARAIAGAIAQFAKSRCPWLCDR